jgi:hypothetical protein
MVNLINQHGSEGVLEKAFANTVKSAALPNVSYEAFDFHKECPKLDWSRLNVLLDRLSSPMDDFGYFLILRDQSVVSEQVERPLVHFLLKIGDIETQFILN